MLKPEAPENVGPLVALLERKTTLSILGLGALAVLCVFFVEILTHSIAPHDRYLEPVLVLVLTRLFFRLWNDPSTLLSTQRAAVGLIQGYFLASALSLVILTPQAISPYWVSSTYMWMLLISLLLHITWPQRAALFWTLSMLVIVSIPPLAVRPHVGEALWRQQYLPQVINACLVQLAFLFSLMGVSRMRQGVMEVLSTQGRVGPEDARAALASWLQTQTAELATARDHAEAASKAKSRFVAVMSHELRTPLHAIMVSTDLLADVDNPPKAAQQQRLVQTIRNSGHHLMSLIDQVLDMSRIEIGKMELKQEPLDIDAVLERAVQSVTPMVDRKAVSIDTELAPGLALRRIGDSMRLTQVLINLLANACKFTDHGQVRVTVKAADHDQVCFEVIDTGMGMSPEVQQHIFEAFYQADRGSTRRHGGVGLGLTITRDLVTLMGGHMEIDSEQGVGTRIALRIPLAVVSEPVATPPNESRSLDGALSGVRVLVVEDDPVNAMLACEVLRLAGAWPESVDSGEAALAILKDLRADLVLMDFRMPGMDGIETTRRIRQGEAGSAAQQVPVIGLTANAYREDREQCMAAGMNDVLTKPIERQALISTLAFWREAKRA